MALESEGYNTQTYNDGSSALEGLTGNPPDLAILDIKMPRMDGMELLRRLRQMTEMPVIFLTSKDEEIDELFGLKMGADDYIRKPFSQRLLVERVKVVLRRAAPRLPVATEARSPDQRSVKGSPSVSMQRSFSGSPLAPGAIRPWCASNSGGRVSWKKRPASTGVCWESTRVRRSTDIGVLPAARAWLQTS